MAMPQGPAPADSQGDDNSPQGQGPQGGPPPQAEQGGGAISQLIDQVGGALQHLEQVFASSKSLPPEDKQMISQIVEMYGQLVQSLGSDGDADDSSQGGAQGQPSPMEAGGNKGAVPAPGQ